MKELREHLYDEIDFSGKKVLEVECGTGQLLAELGEKFRASNVELFGIDINDDRLKIAKKYLKKYDIQVSLQRMDILDNAFKDGLFDIVVTHYFFCGLTILINVLTKFTGY